MLLVRSGWDEVEEEDLFAINLFCDDAEEDFNALAHSTDLTAAAAVMNFGGYNFEDLGKKTTVNEIALINSGGDRERMKGRRRRAVLKFIRRRRPSNSATLMAFNRRAIYILHHQNNQTSSLFPCESGGSQCRISLGVRV